MRQGWLQRYVIGFSGARALWVSGALLALYVSADLATRGRLVWQRTAVGSDCDCPNCLAAYPNFIRLTKGYPQEDTLYLFGRETRWYGPVIAYGLAATLVGVGIAQRIAVKAPQATRR